MITTKNICTNVPEVLAPFNYNTAILEATQFMEGGDKRKALEVFKNSVAGEKDKTGGSCERIEAGGKGGIELSDGNLEYCRAIEK